MLAVAQTDARNQATKVHAGASIVDQEIQRQREREAQLRAERELLAAASLSSPSSSPSVTPLTPWSVDRRPAKVVDAERLSKRRTFDGESSLVSEMDEQRQREDELRRQRATSDAVNGHTTDGRAPAGHVINQARGVTKVRPLGRPDDDEEEGEEGAGSGRLSFITPRSDTLIEREIRITRQREGSLRRVRGYPAINQQQTSVEVPLSGFGRQLQAAQPSTPTSPSPRTSPRSAGPDDEPTTDDNVAMKRLATNRLRLEILRERKREVDLRNQGKIYTISEEHIERPPLLAEMLTATSPRTSPRDVRVEDGEQNDSVVNSDGRQHTQHHHRQQQQQQQQRSQSNRPQPHEVMGKRRLVGEKLIEQEVRDLRRREQELRSVRRDVKLYIFSCPF